MQIGHPRSASLSVNPFLKFSIPAWAAIAVVFMLAMVTVQPASAQTLLTIYNFAGDPDGSAPGANVIRDSAGNLYGTTISGGTNNGTVFKIDAAGNETILHTFAGTPDGSMPWAALARDAQGNLYGTTSQGGAFNYGVVFKIDSAGKESVLHSFAGAPDGATPFSGLTLDSEGNLYGVTLHGGSGDCAAAQYGGTGCGTVFELNANGDETVLYSFQGGTDGAEPEGVLLRDSKGNLYGTTEVGGDVSCPGTNVPGCGTVFMVSASGAETILYSFAGFPNDGEGPESGVIAAGGNLYGTTFWGGAHGWGTVFELTRSGSEKLLYSFGAIANDGQGPEAGLVADPQGNLYGTTQEGGGTGCAGSGCGTIFRVTLAGKETSVPFNESPAGCVPFAGLIRDAAGDLYGTNTNCGIGYGTVYKAIP